MSDSTFNTFIEKIQRDKKELASSYNTDKSKIIYVGDNKYIVVTRDGKEIRIQFQMFFKSLIWIKSVYQRLHKALENNANTYTEV